MARSGPGVVERSPKLSWRVSMGARSPTWPWCGAVPVDGPRLPGDRMQGHMSARRPWWYDGRAAPARAGRASTTDAGRPSMALGFARRNLGLPLPPPRWGLESRSAYRTETWAYSCLEATTDLHGVLLPAGHGSASMTGRTRSSHDSRSDRGTPEFFRWNRIRPENPREKSACPIAATLKD